MNKRKWIWRGIIALIVLYAVFAGISRHVYMNRLARDVRYGTREAKIAAAKQLMKRDRLYDKLQAMPESVRISAVDAIEEIPGELTVKQCLILLKDAEESVRVRVTEALTVLGEDHIELLVPALKDSDGNVRKGAADALVGIGPKVIPYVQPAVKESQMRVAAGDALARVGEPSVPALVELLKDDDQDVRMAAAYSLGKIGSKKGTPALLKATGDVAAVRRVAISALCEICDPESIDLLVEVLTGTGDDGEVRARAARALSVIEGERAIAILSGALGDLDLKVRSSVITGLQRIGAPAVKPVFRAMSTGSADVRRAGAKVLSAINSAESASVLLRLVRDSDPAVRASAASGLGKQTTPVPSSALVPLLSDDGGRVAEEAAVSLICMGRRAVPSLISALRSAESNVVKYRAADVLGKIGSPAVPALLGLLGKDVDTTRWAAYALGQTGDPRAKAALEKLETANDPDLARIVEQALGRL